MIVEDEFNSGEHGKKRKKRSFVQYQKRQAKKGSFGRGTQLSQDMFDYFINIMQVINSKKNDKDEMRILASNIFQEIEGNESEFCCNQIISRVVENLLQFSSDEEFSSFIDKFSTNLRPIFNDTFGSHVLQQTVIVSYTKYKKYDKDPENELRIKFFNYIVKVSNFLYNNLDDFVWNTYSNSIARTIFNVLSGHPVKGEIKSETYKNEEKSEVPLEFNELLKKFAKKLLSMPQFTDFFNEQINSGLLQSLLVTLGNNKESCEIIEKILNFYESGPLDLMDADNTPFVRLLEVVLTVANKADIKKIYKLAVKENLVELAKSRNGNFIVQKLILNCTSKKLFGKLFAKIECEMENIVGVGNSGVLFAVVKACRNLEICQGSCMTMLTNTFHIQDNKNLVVLLSTLSSSKTYDKEFSAFTLHGCLVVQEVLNFKKPINVVNSILGMSESDLLKLLCDMKGCHITDAFFSSLYVGEKNKDKLFKKLQGHYAEMATSKHGSRSLDEIWSAIGINQKVALAEELLIQHNTLKGNTFGKNFAWKIHLDSFRRDKEEWIKVFKSSETAEKYFADILIPRKKQKTE